LETTIPQQSPRSARNFRLALGLAAAIALGAPSSARATDWRGGDWGGADLVVGDYDTMTGVFTNVGAFLVNTSRSVPVTAIGPIEVHAQVIDIAGLLSADRGGENGGGPGTMFGSPGVGFGGGIGGATNADGVGEGGGGGGYGAEGGGGVTKTGFNAGGVAFGSQTAWQLPGSQLL
jgi:hypothetical protein